MAVQLRALACCWSWGAASLRRRRRLRVSGDAMLKSCMMPPGQSSSVAMSAPAPHHDQHPCITPMTHRARCGSGHIVRYICCIIDCCQCRF